MRCSIRYNTLCTTQSLRRTPFVRTSAGWSTCRQRYVEEALPCVAVICTTRRRPVCRRSTMIGSTMFPTRSTSVSSWQAVTSTVLGLTRLQSALICRHFPTSASARQQHHDPSCVHVDRQQPAGRRHRWWRFVSYISSVTVMPTRCTSDYELQGRVAWSFIEQPRSSATASSRVSRSTSWSLLFGRYSTTTLGAVRVTIEQSKRTNSLINWTSRSPPNYRNGVSLHLTGATVDGCQLNAFVQDCMSGSGSYRVFIRLFKHFKM